MDTAKKYKDVPEDMREGVRELELALLATASEIKQTIKASYQTGASVPEDLQELYSRFTDAMQYKSIAPVLLDALNKPACIVIHNGQTTEDKDSIEQYAIHFIITFKMLPAETRQIVGNALIHPEARQHLPVSEYYILANTLVMLQTATHHATEIQELFYLTSAEINTAIKEARALDYIAIPLDESIPTAAEPKQQSLPGLEPTPADTAIKAAAIIRQKRVFYELITKRGTSKLDRKAGYMINTLDNEITMPLDIRRTDPIEASRDIIRIKWNAPYNAQGEQLRVTPFDQEIETVISNFYDEGYPAVTTEQIYAALTGQSGHSAKPNAGTLKAIERSIEKLNTIPVSIRRIQNGTPATLDTGEIQVAGGDETIIAEYGTILDTTKSGYIEIQGKRRIAWISSRRGYLYSTEKMLGRLRSIKQETLNLATSGITFTELSFILRRFCLMEIARFRTTASYAISDNKFTLDSMYLYEAAPELVIIAPNMKRELKAGETPNEQAKIRVAKKARRDLLQKILQHFKQTGEIIEWDFCAGDKKLPYTLDKDEPTKRKYKGTPDSVYIQVQKTLKTLGTISTIERRIETTERNRRRANKKDSQE